MTGIESVTLETPDPTTADDFHAAAFGPGTPVRARVSEAPAAGFRGFTLSLVVSQPSTVDALVGAALEAGATELKPAKKSLWGYGGVVRGPDGTIWTVASSSKKDRGPATREIDEFVLQLGVADVAASKRFYVRMRYEDPARTVRDVELSSVSFDLRVEDAAGEELQRVSLIVPTGSFLRCETPSRMPDDEEVGGPHETCDIFLAPPASEPALVSFAFGIGAGAEATWAP